MNNQSQPQQHNQNYNNNRGNNRGNYRGNNRGQYRGNNRGNNPRFQNNRGSFNNRQQYQNNYRPRNPWQNPYYQQSGRIHCNICNKFGHPPSACWFRPQYRGPPPLPYTNVSAPSYTSQPQMNPMIPQPAMPPSWSPHYDVNQHYQEPQQYNTPKN